MQISVIVPARNATETLHACLAALRQDALAAGARAEVELIVVDDASTDETPEVARRGGARVVTLAVRSGPAVARNRGVAAAAGAVIFFVDADVEVRPGTITRMAAHFERASAEAALMGSYDDTPAARGFFSLYKNLFHHYIHQTSRPEAETFWAGCGAVRRSAFLAVGGFDESYSRPSIEDIELGYRLRRAGYRIRLDRELQVTHLKHWTLRSMVVTDITCRAIPWSRLLVGRDRVESDLNFQPAHRLSVVLIGCGVGLVVGIPLLQRVGLVTVNPLVWAAPTAAFGAVVVLNAALYRFFARRVGLGFALLSIPVHFVYYLYSGATFGWILVTSRWRAR